MPDIFGEDFRPRRHHQIMEYAVEDELSLYDPRTEEVHILNPTAALVWKMCDGNRLVQEISAEIADVYGLAPSATQDDIKEVLSKFLQAGLIR